MDPRTDLRAIPLFLALPESHLDGVARRMEPVSFPAGAVILREGGEPKGFFLIRAGAARVVRNFGRRSEKEYTTLGAGAFFGEMSLLDSRPPSATVVATEPFEGLLLTPAHFQEVLDEHRAVARILLATLSQRVRLLEEAGMREILVAQEAVMLSLAKLAEFRDPETGAHLERIRHYCRLLAEAARREPAFADEVDEEFVDTIFRASPLHDIGKVGVPDAVLLAPRRLTAEETAVMRRHPAIGAATIRQAMAKISDVSFLAMAHEIALRHHEWHDGTGYPDGLAGEAIPLAARIMAIADVFDAFRSDRVYRRGLSHEETLRIVREGRGTQFDPRLVDLFLGCEGQLLLVADQYERER